MTYMFYRMDSRHSITTRHETGGQVVGDAYLRYDITLLM